MKGKKWLYYSLFTASVFLGCLLTSYPAKAFNLGTVGGGMFDYGTNGSQFSVYYNPTDGTKTYKFSHPDGSNFSIVGSATGDSAVPSNGQMINLWLRNQSATYKIPASSLVSFSIRYVVPSNADYLQFNGINSSNWTSVLSSQCKTNNEISDNTTTGETDFVCQYLVYVGDDYTVGDGLQFDNRIAYIRASKGITIIVSSYTYARVSDASGGGSVDLDNIEDLLQDIVDQLESNNYSASISNISAVLENIEDNQPSASDIAEAINDAEETQMLETQNEADEQADNAGDEAESATQSLRETISSIIQLARETPASDCNIRINFRIDTGVMNMCQMPEQFRTVIQSITTIVGTIAILNISYELLLLYIDHIRSFQDGGKEER